ncbi:Sexual differentiation process putative subtilase-type proteinase isp6 [Smittium mucronatum]|uniref:Sexual differentiation process putative subtilase-type proteinase isp6 n=1 Tax=Smittium mucronatum TaxID=133383 RepID=A0A1R0GUU6_9FUNG|nr:Sexual differentiation process putative subtilase-type proteinase isp6 [Smittium mucronatum]
MNGTKYVQEIVYAENEEIIFKRNDKVFEREIHDNKTLADEFQSVIKRSDSDTYFQRYAPWAIARLSSPTLPKPIHPYGNGFSFKNGGDGVVIYVIDTGVNVNHSEFGGRVSFGPNVAFNQMTGVLSEDDYDYNGHGTFVASLAIGLTVGVAKKARVVSYKAVGVGAGLNDIKMINSLSDIIYLDSSANDGRKASLVVCTYNLVSRSRALDDALTEFSNLGYTYVSAAGNQRANSCNRSPPGSLATIVAGGTNMADGYYTNSNYGPCIDVFAPGADLMAASIGVKVGTEAVTGTSYSAGLVAGVCALILGQNPTMNQDQVRNQILTLAVKDVLTSTLTNSSNILLQVPY